MNNTSENKNATTGIVLGAFTFAILCAAIFGVHPQSATVAKSAHFHARMIYAGHLSKTANG